MRDKDVREQAGRGSLQKVRHGGVVVERCGGRSRDAKAEDLGELMRKRGGVDTDCGKETGVREEWIL